MGKYLGGLMFTSPIILSYFAAFKLFGGFFFSVGGGWFSE